MGAAIPRFSNTAAGNHSLGLQASPTPTEDPEAPGTVTTRRLTHPSETKTKHEEYSSATSGSRIPEDWSSIVHGEVTPPRQG